VERFNGKRSWRNIQGAWIGAARKIANARQPIDMPMVNALAKAFREDGGKFQLSPGGLAKRVGYSRRKTCAALGALEAGGLLDRFFVRGRVEGIGVFQRANLYLPRMPAPATDALGPLDRMDASLTRWRTALGLEMHPWGLNGVPVSIRHLMP